jgi:hypothetical protein
MQVTRTSTLSGVKRTRELDITPEQIKAWQDGEWIQSAMANLSQDDREFIMTGITQEEWDEAFKEEE